MANDIFMDKLLVGFPVEQRKLNSRDLPLQSTHKVYSVYSVYGEHWLVLAKQSADVRAKSYAFWLNVRQFEKCLISERETTI